MVHGFLKICFRWYGGGMHTVYIQVYFAIFFKEGVCTWKEPTFSATLRNAPGGICISALLGAFAPANPHLFGGIMAGYVCGGISLGVSQGLRLGKCLVKGEPFFAHPGQHIIGGPVDDSNNLPDPVGRQALF
jgi:hypothetical protein